MQLLYLVVVGVLGLSLGARGDDCAPPKPGDKVPTPSQCCKKERKIPEVMKKNIPKCSTKFPIPAAGKSDPKEFRNAIVCTAECVFEESGLLKLDGKVDLAAFKEMLAATYPEDKTSNANVDKCITTIASRIDQSSDCKSGAFELEQCLRRNCFLHCPKEMWTSSKECEDLKKKVEMCPAYPVLD